MARVRRPCLEGSRGFTKKATCDFAAVIFVRFETTVTKNVSMQYVPHLRRQQETVVGKPTFILRVPDFGK